MLPVTYWRINGVCTGDGVPELVIYCAVDEDGRGEGDEGEKKGSGSEDPRHCSDFGWRALRTAFYLRSYRATIAILKEAVGID